MASTFSGTTLFKPFGVAWTVPLCNLAKNSKKAMSEPGDAGELSIRPLFLFFALLDIDMFSRILLSRVRALLSQLCK
jgi:hypothetical protein